MEPNETTATIAKGRLSHRAVAVRRRNTPWVMRFCLLLAGEKSRNLVSQDCNEIAYMSSDPISLVTAPQQRHHAKLQAPRCCTSMIMSPFVLDRNVPLIRPPKGGRI